MSCLLTKLTDNPVLSNRNASAFNSNYTFSLIIKHLMCPKNGGQYSYYYGMNRVIYRVSNVYLSCIYRIYNVVDSELVAGDNRSLAGRAVVGRSLRCRLGRAL